MSLLSSWDEMDVLVNLLSDDVWAAEDDKTGFLSVGVDSFWIDYFYKYDRFPWPWYKLVIKKKNMINEDKWESSLNRKMIFFHEW